ncbi:MAG: hypothetical protein Q7U04_06020 [Bacteriovorax sp.]|nr:hypothetical protein [Bacteriovorax sp.]
MGGIQLFKDKIKDEQISLLLKFNVLITLIVLVMSLFNVSKQLFITEAEGLTFDASKRDFCSLVTSQLIDKKISKKIVTESLFGLVAADNYKNLYFDGEETISAIWASDETCKVLVKTKTGLRAFDYFFDQSKDFKYYYKVKKITENEFFEKENS